jgi:hypothetical protein
MCVARRSIVTKGGGVANRRGRGTVAKIIGSRGLRKPKTSYRLEIASSLPTKLWSRGSREDEGASIVTGSVTEVTELGEGRAAN